MRLSLSQHPHGRRPPSGVDAYPKLAHRCRMRYARLYLLLVAYIGGHEAEAPVRLDALARSRQIEDHHLPATVVQHLSSSPSQTGGAARHQRSGIRYLHVILPVGSLARLAAQSRVITIRWIWLVPSKICITFIPDRA